MPSIGLVANIYNECNALPGWLETHLPYFDDVRVLHTGPRGELSNDGTIEILEKWRVPYLVGSIDDGFGVTRTRAIRSSPCDYVMLLDADERFYPVHRVLSCSGMATPHSEVDEILRTYGSTPEWDNIARLGANLKVTFGEVYNQGEWLRRILLEGTYDAVASIRRHWHDPLMLRPTQDWHADPDWQLRIVRNSEDIYFAPITRMHERLAGASNVFHAEMQRGPFFDHFHFHFKRMEQRQRNHDVAIYNSINDGHKPPTWEEFKGTC